MGTAIPTVNGVRSQSDLCPKLNLSKCPEEVSPHPRSSALSSPTSSARSRPPARAHEAPVGLHQEEQPPGPRQQAVLHPRQEDGQGLRLGEDARLRHGQAHRPPSILRRLMNPDDVTYHHACSIFIPSTKYKTYLADEFSIERRCFA